MSLVTCPCRNVLASGPVSASLPRSERSTTKVTDERLVIVLQPGQPPLDLALQLVQHALARDAVAQGRAHDRRLLGAVEPLEQRQQTLHVEWDVHCHKRASAAGFA